MSLIYIQRLKFIVLNHHQLTFNLFFDNSICHFFKFSEQIIWNEFVICLSRGKTKWEGTLVNWWREGDIIVVGLMLKQCMPETNLLLTFLNHDVLIKITRKKMCQKKTQQPGTDSLNCECYYNSIPVLILSEYIISFPILTLTLGDNIYWNIPILPPPTHILPIL